MGGRSWSGRPTSWLRSCTSRSSRCSRPPGAPEGITLDVPVVVSVGPGMPLTDGRYSWRLEIDDASDEDWLASFHVRVG